MANEFPDDDGAPDSASTYPAALHAALAGSNASTEEARAFLRQQERLTKLQVETQLEQNAFEVSHLRWRRFNDQMKGALQIMLVGVGVLIVVAIAAGVWTASQDSSLVIEAFSVPPDMAARGVTGQAVAAQLLDKLSEMQDATQSGRAANSYANNWGDDIKVQIPDTGVSVGEVYRALVLWLGHQSRITGWAYRSAKGIAITLRASAAGDWKAALADMEAAARAAATQGPGGQNYVERWALPLRAQALAMLGRSAEAMREAEQAPLDCDLCLRMRGVAAASAGDWKSATRWFTQSETFGPSLPFADTDWGDILLRKGDLDEAIAKFKLANQKGPHFADPLEMWGEALIAKNRSDLALAKFEEADKYAPNWGRLHLKWGEALWYVGNKDEAKKQFSIASHLDLSVADTVALARWRASA